MSTEPKVTRAEQKAARRAERDAAAAAAEAAAARKRRLAQLGGVLAVAAAIVAVFIAISAGGTEDGPTKKAGETVAGQTEVTQRFAGIPQAGIVLGQADAPVTLVEFADMQCPFCAEFARDGLPTLVEREVRAGTLRVEFRSMAFIGDDSQTLARAVAGAGAQGKLWQALDLFFINQGRENSGYADDAFVRTTLSGIPGLDVDKAIADGEGSAGTEAINQAQQLADQNGISSTPSFLIGKTGGKLEKLELSSLDGSQIRDKVQELAGT
ncbi:DsbA family protein [Paraconexibacter algicola]|uniref:Thioredoxin-like fold domain-containing protein n=1 Tax=Paraconexibacter algicola TaxID=2133960 RepID=A0A2T4UHV9_9ACTN|nr:thioredoxin domain-containing protein [Paraconexibacter algicola]PTL58820.1 hypothetical protein C7Y72_03715 [Paraconexibacter algicola]